MARGYDVRFQQETHWKQSYPGLPKDYHTLPSQSSTTMSGTRVTGKRLMGDIQWDAGAQRDQLEDGLSEELNAALILRPRTQTLDELIVLCQELDSSFRARNKVFPT
jgi:hypothetical protein